MSRLDTFIEALRQHIDTEITESERARNALADAWYALDLYAALTAAQNGS